MDFIESVYNDYVYVLGFVEKKCRDWFDEDEKIQVLLCEKSKTLTILLKGGYPAEEGPRFSEMFKKGKAIVQ